MSKQSYDAPHEDGPDEDTLVQVYPTVTRERITGISDRLKGWHERTIEQRSFTPVQISELLCDLGYGLNDCLAYIEQQETNLQNFTTTPGCKYCDMGGKPEVYCDGKMKHMVIELCGRHKS